MNRRLLLPLTLLLCSCQQQVQTYTLREARDFLDMADNTMSRGINYLGSDEEYHYFEISRDFAIDPRFRIGKDTALYSPAETHPYHSWFPERTAACEKLKGLHLRIFDEPGGFIYQITPARQIFLPTNGSTCATCTWSTKVSQYPARCRKASYPIYRDAPISASTAVPSTAYRPVSFWKLPVPATVYSQAKHWMP